LGTAGLSEDGQQMQQLADACLVIDALDPSAKEELIRNVCSKELTAYQQIFQGTGTITCFYLSYFLAAMKPSFKDRMFRLSFVILVMTTSCFQVQCNMTRSEILLIL